MSSWVPTPRLMGSPAPPDSMVSARGLPFLSSSPSERHSSSCVLKSVFGLWLHPLASHVWLGSTMGMSQPCFGLHPQCAGSCPQASPMCRWPPNGVWLLPRYFRLLLAVTPHHGHFDHLWSLISLLHVHSLLTSTDRWVSMDLCMSLQWQDRPIAVFITEASAEALWHFLYTFANMNLCTWADICRSCEYLCSRAVGTAMPTKSLAWASTRLRIVFCGRAYLTKQAIYKLRI